MKITLLYPSDPFNSRDVDGHYKEEYQSAKNAGLKVCLFDIQNIVESTIIPQVDEDSAIVYRGWMLSEREYTFLEKRFHAQLLTSLSQYLSTHYLPYWYPTLKAFTILSIITDEERVLQEFNTFNGKAFIKDYVKSLKSGKGSIVDSAKDLSRAINDMKKYRGFIEGGIVLRKVIDLQPHSEMRFFVVNDTVMSPFHDNDKYSLAETVVALLKPKQLKFYSIDIATTIQGNNIVIEIGDGQVSDYVDWNLPNFIEVLQRLEF